MTATTATRSMVRPNVQAQGRAACGASHWSVPLGDGAGKGANAQARTPPAEAIRRWPRARTAQRPRTPPPEARTVEISADGETEPHNGAAPHTKRESRRCRNCTKTRRARWAWGLGLTLCCAAPATETPENMARCPGRRHEQNVGRLV